MSRAIRLAIVVSHPIQHFTPFYRKIASEPGLELKVFYCSKISLKPYFDREMNAVIEWRQELLAGYDSEFLLGAERAPQAGFFSINNPAVKAALSRFRPDVVLLYGYSQLTTLYALFWCLLHRVSAIMVSDSELLHQRNLYKRIGKQLALRSLFKAYAGFLCAGDNNRRYLQHYGAPEHKIFRSPLPMDEELYSSARAERVERRTAYRQKLGISSDTFVVLSVGKLSSRKRPYDILDAAKILRDRMHSKYPVCFVVAGAGELQEELRRRITREELRVRLLGFVNVDELPDLYCSADLFLHAAEHDPHPLVLAEAASIGLPLIVSDRVGAIGRTDIARVDENALVYRCGDPLEIAQHVLKLVNDAETRHRMAAASIEVFGSQALKASLDGLMSAVNTAIGERRVLVPAE